MGRDTCRTCELLKELYQLKLNQFLLAARSTSEWGWDARTDAAQVLKQESLDALTALMQHAKACYGLTEDKAA